MPIMGYCCFIRFRRYKFYCEHCGKVRSEAVDFISSLTPHFTSEYAWWLGCFCEIAAVSRVAEFNSLDGMTTWRIDYNRMIAIPILGPQAYQNIQVVAMDQLRASRQ
jgi:hypothetical protein